MKKLITITAALALFLGFSHNANAQLKLGASGSIAIPMGDFADFAGTGVGGQISADYFLTDNISGGIEVGYLTFSGEEFDFGGVTLELPSANLTVIQLTGQYHLMPGEMLDFYGGLGLGITIAGSDADGAESETEFGVSPRLGAIYNINDMIGIDLNIGYNILFDEDEDAGQTFNTSYLGINIGVVYSLN